MKNLDTIETKEEFIEFMESKPFRNNPMTPEEKEKIFGYCDRFGVSRYIIRVHDDIFPHK